jgi:hypothetical protein
MITGVGFMLQSLLVHDHLCGVMCPHSTTSTPSKTCFCDSSGGRSDGLRAKSAMLQQAAALRRNMLSRFFDSATGRFSETPEIDRLMGGDGKDLPERSRPPRQCAQAMPLYLGLLNHQGLHLGDNDNPGVASVTSASATAMAVKALVDSVRLPPAHGHLLVGTFGIKWVLMALSDYAGSNGHMSAYEAVTQRAYPGYGFMLDYAAYYATRHEHRLRKDGDTGKWQWEGRGEGQDEQNNCGEGRADPEKRTVGGAAVDGGVGRAVDGGADAEELFGADGSDTMWETWEASHDVYSRNHAMLSSAVVWLYHSLAGLRIHPLSAGADRLLVFPKPIRKVGWCSAFLRTIRGRATVRWELSAPRDRQAVGGVRSDGSAQAGVNDLTRLTFLLWVTVPPNTIAQIGMPAAPGSALTEGMRVLPKHKYKRVLAQHGGGEALLLDIGSGTYSFRSEVLLQ